MIRAILAVAACALVPVAGAAGDVYLPFQTPSHNIACAFNDNPDYLRCEIDSGLLPKPARPKVCYGDFGTAVAMMPTGTARAICISDTVKDPKARVLAYGTSWRRAGFTCVVATAGLRCTNRSSHGFFLSRARSNLF